MIGTEAQQSAFQKAVSFAGSLLLQTDVDTKNT